MLPDTVYILKPYFCILIGILCMPIAGVIAKVSALTLIMVGVKILWLRHNNVSRW